MPVSYEVSLAHTYTQNKNFDNEKCIDIIFIYLSRIFRDKNCLLLREKIQFERCVYGRNGFCVNNPFKKN